MCKETIQGVCGHIKQHTARNHGKTFKTACGKPATHKKGEKLYCRHHAGVGRYVLRDGEIGPVLARFDTEQELHENAHLFPDAQLQKITKSARKTINRKA